VLIADDQDVSLTTLGATLRKAGFDVECARNGREALDRVRAGGIRLVITDWEMPVVSGIELCRAIREADWSGYVYIILVTSHDSAQEKVEGLSAGADDFITKPFNPSELIARVRIGERILSMETREVAIFALAKLADSRDPETGDHLERVRSYSHVLARQLAKNPAFAPIIDAEFIRLIYLTSPLHDIGKVGIPDSVLLKPGRLSDHEFEIMKSHTTIGEETLGAALEKFPGVRFLEMARDIAATHHERYNGKGYPRGLRGDAIPLSGRIVALADVYDALNSRRVYKPAFGHQIAASMIVKDSGSHFDPAVVAAFVDAEAEFIAIRTRFGEQSRAAA
jgi:putative two-component system response regulator